MLVFLVQWNVRILEMIVFKKKQGKLEVKEILCREFIKTDGKERQSRHLGGNRQVLYIFVDTMARRRYLGRPNLGPPETGPRRRAVRQ